ncbi:MAG: T9SS type A sorting domain-containing protein [Saprospiraceae bacterium]|nr:T9SS type A sorting domain-containing protein [Saprospiraceae bacterium]
MDINLSSNFVLHPNPAKSLVYVTAFQRSKIQIISVDNRWCTSFNTDSPLFLNVSNFKSGMYIIKVEDSISGHHSYKKLIIAD